MPKSNGRTWNIILAATATVFGVLWGVQTFANATVNHRVTCLEKKADLLEEVVVDIRLDLREIKTLLEKGNALQEEAY